MTILIDNDGDEVGVKDVEPIDMDVQTKAAWKAFREDLVTKTKALESVELDDIALGPWSHSKLKTLSKCPLSFYLQYILKAKLPPVLAAQQDTGAADVGTTAHRILEHVFSGHTVKTAYALAKQEFVPEKLSEETWVEKLVSVEYNITEFKERIDNFKRAHKVKKIYTELRLGVTRDWKPSKFFASDVWMRGVVDFVMVLENGDAILIDWKYGVPITSGIRNNKQQLDSYLPLVNFGFIPLQGATAGVGFVKDGGIILGNYVSKEEIEKKLKNTVEFNVQGAIDGVTEMGNFGHIVNSNCKYCSYAPLCKSRNKNENLKEIETLTKKFIQIKAV